MKKLIQIALCILFGLSVPALGAKEKERVSRAPKRSAKAWGMETQVDLRSCDPYRIRSSEAIQQYAVELSALLNLDAKRIYRAPIVAHTGEEEDERGYSMVQLIGKAIISAQFINNTNAMYLTVFHCKPYNPKEIAEFTKEYFAAHDYNLNVTVRH